MVIRRTVVAPEQFPHVGSSPPKTFSVDPRKASTVPVDVDLRACEFIGPPALLWCAIYTLLAKHGGSETTFLVPFNTGVCVYLKSARLLAILAESGVTVDERGIKDQDDRQIVLPLSRFSSETEVDRLVETATDRLLAAGLAAANLVTVVGAVFAELANNAVQHSESPIGAFGFVQFKRTQKGDRFICVVADGGIGIRASLERNPNLKNLVPYDWSAIELAVQERISGTGDATRGIGLSYIADDMQKAGRQMIIHSGQGWMSVSALNDRASRTAIFPGTLVSVEIPA